MLADTIGTYFAGKEGTQSISQKSRRFPGPGTALDRLIRTQIGLRMSHSSSLRSQVSLRGVSSPGSDVGRCPYVFQDSGRISLSIVRKQILRRRLAGTNGCQADGRINCPATLFLQIVQTAGEKPGKSGLGQDSFVHESRRFSAILRLRFRLDRALLRYPNPPDTVG